MIKGIVKNCHVEAKRQTADMAVVVRKQFPLISVRDVLSILT